MAAYSEFAGHEEGRVKFHRGAPFIAISVAWLDSLSGHGLPLLFAEWFLVFAIESLRHRSRWFHVKLLSFFWRRMWFGRKIVKAMRPEERNSRTREWSSVLPAGTGLGFWYVMLTLGHFTWWALLIVACQLAFVDPAAKVAGVLAAKEDRRRPLPRWLIAIGANPKKSLNGFLAGWWTGLMFALPIAYVGKLSLLAATASSLAAAVAELFGKSGTILGDDNFRIPISAGVPFFLP